MFQLLFATPILSQQIYAQWAARYDGPGSDTDYALAIVVDGDGNSYVTGKSQDDYLTIKYDHFGNELWVSRYDGPASGVDEALDITVDASGNVYVAGYTEQSGEWLDYLTLAYDAGGALLWSATYAGTDHGLDLPSAVRVDGGGNVYVTGFATSTSGGMDITTIKYLPSGSEDWVAVYDGGYGNDSPAGLAVDDGGNVYVGGYITTSSGDFDWILIKYDSAGTEIWARSYDGAGHDDDFIADIELDHDGNVFVTGSSHEVVSYYDCTTAKYDPVGTRQWLLSYDGPSGMDDVTHDLTLDAAGNVYITGYAVRVDRHRNVYVCGGSIGAGTNSDVTLIKYSPVGGEVWVSRYDGPVHDDDTGYALAFDQAENIFVTGPSTGHGSDNDYVTIGYRVGPPRAKTMGLLP